MNTLLLKKTLSLLFISLLCLGSILALYTFYKKTIHQNKVNYESNHLIGYFLTEDVKYLAPEIINQTNGDQWLFFCQKNHTKNTNNHYLVIKTKTNNGYNGKIPFFITINLFKNRIVGLMPGEHKETPGLGDQISPKKSDWHQQFSEVELSHKTLNDWNLPIYQGKIDAISGATITSKAIIAAVKNSIHYLLNYLKTTPRFIEKTC